MFIKFIYKNQANEIKRKLFKSNFSLTGLELVSNLLICKSFND